MKRISKKLDNIQAIERLDKQGMAQSIESLALQCQQAWDDVRQIMMPKNYRLAKSVVLNGMGGSALGGDVLESLFGRELRVPFKVTNSYTLPGFVNRNTLCILSSYSGTTEEVLSSMKEARKRKAKIIIICAGGALARAANRFRIPAYIFTPQFNPSNQPRMGIGYSLIGIISLLQRAGLLRISEKDFQTAILNLVAQHKTIGLKVPTKRNSAKRAAVDLYNRVPVVIAAEHLSGNAHIFSNQLNENGKNFAAYFLISEMNHHLMEGLRFPASNTRNLAFFFIESDRYGVRNRKRFAVTKRVLASQRIPYYSYRVKGKNALAQSLETLLFGSYTSFYLAVLNNLDPSPIPVVDYFKKQLSK